ncbi:uncharacterized protein L3040_001466 [Drepanopeziza brunnea f. sp. 'multigermtubi']|uniref:Oxidoreductase n=1 Tax=Marssonina brunnea f. sp. multigermtubi (strain MB_m1) TaxID=1072389 RepID=K1WW86_MARBU|nr:oxidoreductase [Drepanopeziza brunnea f. sp. 'multigermtubi' MB_m1]EKD16727.1 oxidoreductase [Drepanopeziza brunnea f. sp. 'multigermtubi' MB_m1]KAJ5051693.1 hypothetical protein L3040_001466 [Drepanopeziza brunnea f. sp. 'multigermtubi']
MRPPGPVPNNPSPTRGTYGPHTSMSLTPGLLSATATAPPSGKPTILCLHGGGTNSTIFNIQTIRLQRALGATFDFVFIDAPFESPAGPGVMPIFEGCGPYYRWLRPGVEELDAETRALISATLAAKGRHFVGIMGFSQGGQTAAATCLEQQVVAAKVGRGRIGFGVFLNSTSLPVTAGSGVDGDGDRQLIGLPSLHVVGLQDPWREDGERLWQKYFEKDKAKKVEFDVGHRLPTRQEDTEVIAREIKRLYEETKGMAQRC